MPVFGGDFCISKSDEDRLKQETAYKAMRAMGFQAATLGERDFMHGLAFLKEQLEAHPGFFVSANLLDAETQKPLALPYVVRTYKALHGRPEGKSSVRVAITGFLDPKLQPMLNGFLGTDASKVQVADAAVTLSTLMPKLRGEADVVVVLGHGPMDTCTEVAKAVSGIDILVVGHGPYATVPPQNQKVNGATLVANGDRARYGAQVAVTLDTAGTKVEVRPPIALSSAIAEHPKTVALRDAYKAELAKMGGGSITRNEVTPVASLLPVFGGNRFVGSAACAACHPEASKQWEESHHAQALKTLETTKEGINAKRPDCVRCHTVGFGQPSGFTLKAPDAALAGVGCESCHGPGQLHIQRAAQGVRPAAAITRSIGGQLLCIQCHDKLNDPDFNYAVALAKIRHWGQGFPKAK